MTNWALTTWESLSDGDDKAQAQGGEIRRETLIRVSHPGQVVGADAIVEKLQAGDDIADCPFRARVGLPLNHAEAGHSGDSWVYSDPPMADYHATETDAEQCLNGPMLVRSINCDAYPGSTRCHTLRIVSTGFGPASNSSTIHTTSNSQVDAPLVTISASAKGILSPAWRAKPCAAAAPASSCPAIPEVQPTTAGEAFADWTATDIEGDAVDYNTQPQPVSRDQVSVEVSVLRRGPYLDWKTYAASADGSVEYVSPAINVATIQNALNHRTRTAFAGFAFGTLMLTDYKVTRVHHEYMRIGYLLLYDEWRHARQRPKAVLSNSIEGAKTVGAGNIIHLTDVLWLQQFLDSVDMDLGFCTAELAIVDEWGS